MPEISLDTVPAQALWRSIPPQVLLKDAGVRAEAARRIASVVKSAPFAIPGAIPELQALADGEIDALVTAVTSLPKEPGRWQQARFDLRMSLALWGLVHQEHGHNWYKGREHPLARILLAAGLAAWAKDLPPPGRETMQTPRHLRTPAQRTEVRDWQKQQRAYQRLALEWLRDGVTDNWISSLADRIALQPRPLPAAEVAPVQAAPIAGPSRIVMASPIDVTAHASREKREEAGRWNCLARPLPLMSGPPGEAIEEALRQEFPWMEAAIGRIGSELALRQRAAGEPWFHLRPLLLVGPPSCGKSRFARRLGEIVGLHTRMMSVGGSTDSREMAGTARGWNSAIPSAPVRLIIEAQHANPLMVLDEIDKVGSSAHNGRVPDVILAMLEAETAARWYDECLGRPVDLTAISWLFLANDLGPIPGPLRSRLGIVQVDRPAPAHIGIVLDAMLRDIAAELGLEVGRLPRLHPAARAYLERGFARGASLRQVRAALERALAVPDQDVH